jgi:hypothetical protein
VMTADHSGSQLLPNPAKILRHTLKRTTILRYQSLIQVVTSNGIDPIGITARRMPTCRTVAGRGSGGSPGGGTADVLTVQAGPEASPRPYQGQVGQDSLPWLKPSCCPPQPLRRCIEQATAALSFRSHSAEHVSAGSMRPVVFCPDAAGTHGTSPPRRVVLPTGTLRRVLLNTERCERMV